jgi:predicted signal transduction protein with EAL and GGDEF domain
VPCRFGAEEFVVLLPGATIEAAVQKAEEIRGRIEELMVRYVDGNLPRVTISIGVAAYPGSGDSPQSVLKAADEALYRAKDAGRNRVEVAGNGDAPAAGAGGPVRALHHALEAGVPQRGQPGQPSGSLLDAA